jgi:hypothetical protein
MLTPGKYLVILTATRTSSDGKHQREVTIKDVIDVEEGTTREALLEQFIARLDDRIFERFGEPVSTKISADIHFFYAEPN